jgi:hypothetical protein
MKAAKEASGANPGYDFEDYRRPIHSVRRWRRPEDCDAPG